MSDLFKRVAARWIQAEMVKSLRPGDSFSYPGDSDIYEVNGIQRERGGVEFNIQTDKGNLSLLGDEEIVVIDQDELIKKKYGIVGVVSKSDPVANLFMILDQNPSIFTNLVDVGDEKVAVLSTIPLSSQAKIEFIKWYE